MLEVPVATYIGPTCTLTGQAIPFTPVLLSQLYPMHKSYLDKMYTGIQTAVRRGATGPG